MSPWILIPVFFSALLGIQLVKFIYSTIWIPYQIQRHFYSQGIRGPGYRPVYGNTPEFKRDFDRNYNKPTGSFSHDIVHRSDPSYHKWAALYGKTFLFWQGTTPRLVLSDPDMMKEVYLNKSKLAVRGEISPLAVPLFGKGLFILNGDKWSVHRKIANPAFLIDRVKAWVPEVVDSIEKVVKKWGDEMRERKLIEIEVDVLKEFHFLSAEILSRTAFGSDFEEGKHIFESQDQQSKLAVQAMRTAYIPGLRFFPTRANRMRWKLERETRAQIRMLTERDQEDQKNSKTLLNFLLKGGLPIEEVIDECQTFYFAGKEAVAVFLSWTLLLVASSEEWQSKARDEVFQVCKNHDGIPDADTLHDLKTVNLIIYEALRLYTPIPTTFRVASKNIKVGNIDIPAGTKFYLPNLAVHHDTEIWGDDANDFNPSRFLEPRKHLASFSPFGLGSRTCIGQNFAVMEAKMILSIILKHFIFRISPSYVHAPVTFLTVTPQFGAQILFKKIPN